MKKYKYIRAENINNYDDYKIEQVLPRIEGEYQMLIISFDETPVNYSPTLAEATVDEILRELGRRNLAATCNNCKEL